MTSPGYLPPPAVGWFVKKQSVFLEVIAVPTAEAAFGDITQIPATVDISSAAKLTATRTTSLVSSGAMVASAVATKKVSFNSVSGGAGGITSGTKSAWSYTLDFPHTS